MSNAYWLNGVRVVFPVKPYETQLTIMSNIIRGIKQSKNCLIESPTGTGKTLALLCSSLAWAEDNKRKLKVDDIMDPSVKENFNLEGMNGCEKMGHTENSQYFSKKEMGGEKENKRPRTIIYYCTRTHHQISQVISELKRTTYGKNGLKMSILSSRKQSCINSEAKKSSSLNETCRRLIDKNLPTELKCQPFTHVFQMDSFKKLSEHGMRKAWDLEEFIEKAEKLGSCPYFCAQKLSESADIIFTPYNYIFNPLIAEQMNLVLKENILIMDEAHNIEDVCRSAMSANISYDQLTSAFNDLKVLFEATPSVESCKFIKEGYLLVSGFVSSLSNWLHSFDEILDSSDFGKNQKTYDGSGFKKTLTELNIDNAYVLVVSSNYKSLVNTYGQEEYEALFRPSDSTLHLLSNVLLILEHITGNFFDEFVVSITKCAPLDSEDANLIPSQQGGDKLDKYFLGSHKDEVSSTNLYINFMCLNPALAFQSVKGCRSIILASGTLSPISSFSPELCSPFDIVFQTSDHLKKDQAIVYSLSVDLKEKPLRVTFKNMESFYLQDQIGEIVCQLCSVIPAGILCFLPSYTILDKLVKRWKTTSLLESIDKVKNVFIEYRGMSAIEADNFLKKYFKSLNNKASKKGSILFAVVRGRISEGMNFPDDKARAVIAIGIPYPNIKDISVDRKIQYNDNRRRISGGNSKNLISGHDWYNIQAFRALNQAIGRCIRHREDWGAIILIDERFESPDPTSFASLSQSYNSHLSGWVRKRLSSFRNFNDLQNGVKNFFSEKSQELIKPSSETKNVGKKHKNQKTPGSSKTFIIKTSPTSQEDIEDFIIEKNSS